MMNPNLQAEVLQRLKSGRSLAGIGLEQINGRTDLRGLTIPEPVIRESRQTNFGKINTMLGKTSLENVDLEGMDFSGAHLQGLLISGCRINNCIFDGSNCRQLRLWGTEIYRCSFRKADLSSSALGGTIEKKRNQFRAVDFCAADLRGTGYSGGGAEFIDCTFEEAKLFKIDFQGSVFENCTFSGVLREVQFCRSSFRGESFPPNQMKNVDMSGAKLRFVEFRGLDLRDVRWPLDEEHIVVNNYPKVLDYLLAKLKDQQDLTSRKLSAALRHDRKWVGPNQSTGIFNKKDLVEIGGEAGAIEIMKLLSKASQCV